MIYWLSQVFFVVAVICYFITVLQKDKKHVTFGFFITNIFFGAHYLCLEKYSPLILLSHEIVLLISLFFFEKYNLKHKWTIIACSIIGVLDINAIILTWTETISLMPLSASIAFLIGLSFKDVLYVKSSQVYAASIYIVYLVCIQSYAGIIGQSLLFVMAVCGLVLTLRDRKQKKQIIAKKISKKQTIFCKTKLSGISHNLKQKTLKAKKNQ